MRKPSKSSPTLLDIRFSGGVRFKTAREHKDALSLIRRLVAMPAVGIAELDPSAVTLEVLTGGRSDARVFKLTPHFAREKKVLGLPVVVKMLPRAEALQEKTNYDTFARSGLPKARRADLLAFARTRDYAALCYSFVGGHAGVQPVTLTDCLQRGDTKKVDLVLRRIFDPLRATWYGPRLIRTERDIARRYLDRFFAGKRGASKDERTLRACAAQYFKAGMKDGRYVIGGQSFPSPYAVLFASPNKRPWHSCILHGDLNTDNIVVHDRAHAMLIDFMKTGRGHVYEDLVSLEVSVRINYPRDASYGDILETERLIALGHRQPKNPYVAAIRKIRAAASRYFGNVEDTAAYHFAVAAIALRLMEATDLTHAARARITISALWAAKLLAGERLV